MRKSKSWQGEYIPAVSTLIKDRLYDGVTSDADKPVSAILPIDEALEKSKADAARALREHPEWFPFAVLNNKGGDQND